MKKSKKTSKIVKNEELQVSFYFPCPVYNIERPDFLESVKEVSDEFLEVNRKEKELNDIYPVLMSGNFYDDPRISSFVEFVGATAWNILESQGYAMEDKVVSFTEMWTQEHHKHSAQDQHVHGFGSQIVGFYFLETPEDCSNVVFHDPRSGKVQIDLPEHDSSNATPASRMINFKPKPGLLMFTNSWLAHSFTRNAADKPIKFVHFNIITQFNPTACPVPESAPEVAAEVV